MEAFNDFSDDGLLPLGEKPKKGLRVNTRLTLFRIHI